MMFYCVLSNMYRGIQTVWTDLQNQVTRIRALSFCVITCPFLCIQRVPVPKKKTKNINHLASTLMC